MIEVEIAPNKFERYATTFMGAPTDKSKLEMPKTESPAPIVSIGLVSKALKDVFCFFSYHICKYHFYP